MERGLQVLGRLTLAKVFLALACQSGQAQQMSSTLWGSCFSPRQV
jgi:hypothetical protein